MERERINRESVSRTIQQKNNFGEVYMIDNRSNKNQIYHSDSSLQRISDEEEDTLQGKFDTPVQSVEDEDDTLQGKFDGTIQKKNETGMPDDIKAGIENLSGFSMDDVRVHYNSSKPATVQALAYTQGTDIHVAPGQEKHLPHEAWHVAQQMAGRVSPTTNISGVPVNDNETLEKEADVMGAMAIQRRTDNLIWDKSKIKPSLVTQRRKMRVSEIVEKKEVENLINQAKEKKTDDSGSGINKKKVIGENWILFYSNKQEMIQNEIKELEKIITVAPDFSEYFSLLIPNGSQAINCLGFFEKRLNGIKEAKSEMKPGCSMKVRDSGGQEVPPTDKNNMIELKRPGRITVSDIDADYFVESIFKFLQNLNEVKKADMLRHAETSIDNIKTKVEEIVIHDFQLLFDTGTGNIYVIDPGEYCGNENTIMQKNIKIVKLIKDSLNDKKVLINGKWFYLDKK